MLEIIGDRCQGKNALSNDLPPVVVTPDMGLIHPVQYRDPDQRASPYFLTPANYLTWRKSPAAKRAAERQGFQLADDDAPAVAVLLYRKHVITEQPYILDLLTGQNSTVRCLVATTQIIMATSSRQRSVSLRVRRITPSSQALRTSLFHKPVLYT